MVKSAKNHKQLVESVIKIGDYLKSFIITPPQGELAKQQALEEFNKLCGQTKKTISKLQSSVISEIYKEK